MKMVCRYMTLIFILLSFVFSINNAGQLWQETKKLSEEQLLMSNITFYWFLTYRSRMTKTAKRILAIPFVVPKATVTLLMSSCLTMVC
jgi:hypothetical protein